MPLLPREEDDHTPRTRRQVEMDRVRRQAEEERTETATTSAGVTATPTVDLSVLLAAIQSIQVNQKAMQTKQEASQRELQEALKANQEALQTKQEASQRELQEALKANQEALINKLDTGLQEIGHRISAVEKDIKKVSAHTNELQERVDAHDESLQSIKKDVIKLQTREPAVVSTSSKLDLPHFDGASSWTAFRHQFETLMEANAWSDKYALTALTLALRGDALVVLENLPAEGRTIENLLEALETRYGEKHLEHVCRAQLRERTQKPGETLQQWASEIERLVRRAYSSTPETIPVILLQAFVDGIRDTEVRAAVRLAHHTSLKTALAYALEVEAVREEARTQNTREVVTSNQRDNQQRLRFGPMCYGCGERGHIKIDCPKQKEISKESDEEQVIWNRTPTVTLTQVCNGNSLIVEGTLDSKPCSFTVDTGASRTVVRPELMKRTIRWNKQLPACHLQTATGQSVPVLGDTNVELCIGDKVYRQSVLIANISDDCILGLDFLKDHRCVVDISKGVLKFSDQEVCLEGSRPCNLYCLKDTVLAPRSETLVQVKFPSNMKQGRCVIAEDNGLHPSWITARTLLVTEGVTKIRVLNLSNHEIHLKKNTIIGKCEEVKSLRRLNDSTNATHTNEEHVEELMASCKGTLTETEHFQAKKLLLQFKDIFATENDCGRTGLVKHKIDTGDARPIKQRPRRVPWAKEAEVTELVQEMAKNKIIEPSTSPWSSPVVLVKKKDGSTRFCVDYRMLNNVTKKDSYPLPRIDDTLDMLSGMNWFSTVDLKSGYWQVEISPEDKEKTAFSTGIGNGLWQFNVMPFGLCNAPATFERLMERVMVGLLGDVCLVYLDDVIIMGRNFKEHLRNLEKVFTRIRDANLKLSPKKCELFKKEVNYLGHVITKEGVQTDPAKVKAVREWPVPKSKTEVRAFLGLCTYYRRFAKNFADIARPLHRLTEEKRAFIWDLDCDSAFVTLKKCLCESPILGYPSREGRFVVDTDASNTGIGGVLSQVQGDRQVVIAYFSKALSKPERNYCVTRRELLAVVKTLRHFHKYLIGREFTLRTDHAALKWLLQFKNPDGQVARWLEQLQEFHFEIEHRSGKGHNNADALSRRPCAEECQHCKKQETREALRVVKIHGTDDGWTNDNMKRAQEEDKDLRPILDWMKSGNKPQWGDISAYSPICKGYWAQWSSLVLQNGLLCRKWESENGKEVTLQTVVPRSKIAPLLRDIHDGVSGGHLGIKKTLEKVRQRFYWIRCREDVEDWCRKCTACASVKGPQTRSRGKLKLYNVGAPWERIAIDVAGPFPETDSGNRYIIVVQDYFTKWPEVFATPNQEAKTVAEKLVEEVICRFGVPLEIHSDQGRNFESALFRELCQLLGMNKTRTTPAHPQSDGMVERFNQTLENHLAKVVDEHQRDWDKHIPLFLMSYRSAVHDSTGATPARVNFGREMRLPIDAITGTPPEVPKPVVDYVYDLQRQMDDIHTLVRENSLRTSENMKTRYDRRANTNGFEEETLVWLHNPLRKKGKCPKLQAKWEGPYKVITRINDITYRIKQGLRGKPKIVHVDRLARYHGNNDARDEHD